ncbi:MAG: purine-binding chemotaxis protein CheW [Actinobacteria bacterium]|nr:purine-binding chemotaxis protein CheW [Actinomycetota bacterium]
MTTDTDVQELFLLEFFLAEEKYGIAVNKVYKIVRMIEITHLPKMPEFIEGIINLRGSVIPVIDLRKRLGLPQKEYTLSTPIVITEIQNKIIGIVVDSVSSVLGLREENIEIPTELIPFSNYLRGVGKLENELLLILDMDKLITREEKELLQSLS